jgi:hypothetical protein
MMGSMPKRMSVPGSRYLESIVLHTLHASCTSAWRACRIGVSMAWRACHITCPPPAPRPGPNTLHQDIAMHQRAHAFKCLSVRSCSFDSDRAWAAGRLTALGVAATLDGALPSTATLLAQGAAGCSTMTTSKLSAALAPNHGILRMASGLRSPSRQPEGAARTHQLQTQCSGRVLLLARCRARGFPAPSAPGRR